MTISSLKTDRIKGALFLHMFGQDLKIISFLYWRTFANQLYLTVKERVKESKIG